MRFSVLLLSPALAACASPCENVNADQADPAMQTCVFSSMVRDGHDGTFSPDDGAPVAFLAPERPSIEGAFPDGSRLHEEWWAAAGEPMPERSDSLRWVSTTALAPGGERYALGMRWDRSVQIRSASGDTLAVVRVAEGPDEGAAKMGIEGWPNRATHLAFSPDGAVLYGADTQGHLVAWDAVSGTPLWQATVPLDHGGQDGRSITPDGIRALALSDDGARLAAATARGAGAWEAVSGRAVASWVFPGTATSVIAVGFAPDGRYLAVKKSGRFTPPGVRYSSFDANGRPTSVPYREQTEGRKRAPTVFLLRVPG